ncbi:MAG: universal stress protein [Candidatus Accumulibacter sp.]|uniref:universal stress protein n=1 Tax=Accumulibacter sp. TaxID=2053492 RepID=UPI0025CC01C7|nr:universal stress protein [Accumulibacter sp.]MCP5247077.1 universal stress protein [Accumulibacter sp.]
MSQPLADQPVAQGARVRRLLIPVDPTERSRWGLQYALRLQRSGKPVQVALLFVSEPVTAPEVLRFRTQVEIARFQAECGAHILHDAAQPLAAAGVACQEIYREGDIVEQIDDVAEQLGCDEIVLPLPHARIVKLLSRDVVREVIRRAKSVPVVTIDAEGVAEKALDSWV